MAVGSDSEKECDEEGIRMSQSFRSSFKQDGIERAKRVINRDYHERMKERRTMKVNGRVDLESSSKENSKDNLHKVSSAREIRVDDMCFGQ